jgi:predicted AAA+ superfamily ATPase
LGGFPEFFKFGRAILRQIYDDIIVKDVVRRCGIKKEEGIRKMALFLVSDFSREFTYSSLKSMGGRSIFQPSPSGLRPLRRRT